MLIKILILLLTNILKNGTLHCLFHQKKTDILLYSPADKTLFGTFQKKIYLEFYLEF